MTPQLAAAIAAIQPLSFTERQQLLQILKQNEAFSTTSAKEIKALSDQFRQGTTLKQLHENQIPMTVHNLKDLAADFWTKEDSIEDFLVFLKQQRQEVI